MEEHKDKYGLNKVLQVIGVAKSTWYYGQQRKSYEAKYEYLRKPLMEIAEEHPEYGYRRTTAELRERGYRVNHKVVERLHRSFYLTVMRKARKPRANPIQRLLKQVGPRINLVSQLKEIKEFEVIYTDFTEIVFQRGAAKAYFMPLLDHGSRLVIGHALGPSDNTELALEAWRAAKRALRKLGQKVEDIIIHHDQDGVYLGHRWVYEILVNSKARLSYSENGAKENVYMEFLLIALSKESDNLFWEQASIDLLKNIVEERIRYYNFRRKNSALGN